MGQLPRVMMGGPVRDREWAVPLWLGALLGSRYPRELLSLVVIVNDSQDGTLAACEWWCELARREGLARVELIEHNLGSTVDNNARLGDRDYTVYARLRDLWASLRQGEEWLFSVDSDIQVPYWLLQGLVGLAARDEYDLLAAVIDNNWSPAPQHGTNVLVADQDGSAHHSLLAHAGRGMETRPCVVTGACCVIRSELFDMPGLRYLDPTAQPHPAEDNVFCARLLAAGRRIGYVPGLRATHWHRPPAETEWLADRDWWARQAAYAAHRAATAPEARLEAVA